MIVSHRHRFVFIKGIKVAGTSTEIALSQLCGPDDIITPISAVDEVARLGTAGEPRNYGDDPVAEAELRETVRAGGDLSTVRIPRTRFTNHMSLVEVLREVPDARDYQLLFVERSPYSKVISYAHWEAHQAAYNRGEGLPSESGDLTDQVQRLIDSGEALKVLNLPRYLDEAGELKSEGWRFETLAEQLSSFVRQCGGDAGQLVHAKRGVGSDRLEVDTILDAEQIDYINANFAPEFARFGYRQLQQC